VATIDGFPYALRRVMARIRWLRCTSKTTEQLKRQLKCDLCGKEFRARGLKSHQRACPARNLSRDHAESGHRHCEDPFNAILEVNECAG